LGFSLQIRSEKKPGKIKEGRKTHTHTGITFCVSPPHEREPRISSPGGSLGNSDDAPRAAVLEKHPSGVTRERERERERALLLKGLKEEIKRRMLMSARTR